MPSLVTTTATITIALVLFTASTWAVSPPTLPDRYSLQAAIVSSTWQVPYGDAKGFVVKAFYDPKKGYSFAWRFDKQRLMWLKQWSTASKGKRWSFGSFYCENADFSTSSTNAFDPFDLVKRGTFVKKDTIKRSYALYCDVFTVATSEGTHLFWITLDSRSLYPSKYKVVRHVFTTKDARKRASFAFEVMSIGFGAVDSRAFYTRSTCKSNYKKKSCCLGAGCCNECFYPTKCAKRKEQQSAYEDDPALELESNATVPLGEVAHLGWHPDQGEFNSAWMADVDPDAYGHLLELNGDE